MHRPTRDAVRAIILSLYEATTALGIPAALDKIIEKYEPAAKKLREREEQAQRQALEASRRTPYPTPVTVQDR